MNDIVLIVSPPHDIHAGGVAAVLRRDHAVTVHTLDFQSFPASAQATFSNAARTAVRWNGPGGSLELNRVRSVWWRRPQSAEAVRIFNGLDHGQFVQTERDHFLQGLLWQHRCLWVNDPMNNLRASRKIVQLSAAADAGLQVPRTVITNDPAEALDFIQGLQGRAILKRVGAGPGPASRTRLVTPEILKRLDAIVDCPTTFQAYVEAQLDLRVIWIDGDLWAVAIDSQAGSSPEDCRFDNSVDFKPYHLPQTVAEALNVLMSELGLTYGAIDLRLGRDGEHYFLEVNPGGQFVYLELKTGLPLTSALASVLARGTGSGAAPREAATAAAGSVLS